jgi:hypothetical protein
MESIATLSLKIDPSRRATIFELLASPIFDPVRDISLESSYINCLDNLYLRAGPMVLYADKVNRGEQKFMNRFEQSISLDWGMRSSLLDCRDS